MNSGLTNPEVISLAIDPTGDFIHAGTVIGVFDFRLAPPTCAKDAHTLCLNGGRFSVSASFSDAPGALPVQATAVPMTNDTGYFWFFDPANVEMVVKVLTGCSFNSNYWVFAGGLTNVGVEWKVTDTLTGTSKSYSQMRRVTHFSRSKTRQHSLARDAFARRCCAARLAAQRISEVRRVRRNRVVVVAASRTSSLPSVGRLFAMRAAGRARRVE